MRLLLDTHVLLWWLSDDPALESTARDAIGDAESVFVSVASVWEIAIKQRVGKLRAPGDLAVQIERHDLMVLPIDLRHALEIESLPLLHRDPFDRMLVTQARMDDLTIATRDQQIARYDVTVLAA